MIKLAIKNFIVTTVTIFTLLLTASHSNAQQVNMKFLSEVVKACQRDALSPNYYKRMKLSTEITKYLSKNDILEMCVYARYHHSLFMSKFNWLKSSGHILPGYPGSVAVTALANSGHRDLDKSEILDCLVSRNASSNECATEFYYFNAMIAPVFKLEVLSNPYHSSSGYFVYVCPSCVVAQNDVVSSRDIIQAFINWLIKLDKHQIKQIVDILSAGNESSSMRKEIYNTANAAVIKYREVRQRVEQQERERRHQELIGK